MMDFRVWPNWCKEISVTQRTEDHLYVKHSLLLPWSISHAVTKTAVSSFWQACMLKAITERHIDVVIHWFTVEGKTIISAFRNKYMLMSLSSRASGRPPPYRRGGDLWNSDYSDVVVGGKGFTSSRTNENVKMKKIVCPFPDKRGL